MTAIREGLGIDRDRELRVNHRIRAREVRLIDEEGEQRGIVALRYALELARDKGLDLIEVAPHAVPPVCKIMDYGKFKYEQSKRESEARKKARASELKTVRMEPQIDDHDFQFKLRSIQKFLKEGDKVKISVMFRGRSITHPEFGKRLLEQVVQQCAEIAAVERPPAFEGRMMTLILSPRQQPQPGAAPPQPAQAQPRA
ncbi:MAG: translation initiation factor IF-3 [Armatimonadetes bacterium]|nr:translation initiation factor IF-3 [Armatimonadota bacterium]